MNTIKDEIQSCLRLTKKRQIALARVSGVNAPTICSLLKGHRQDVRGRTQDALRRGINILLAEYQETQQANSKENNLPEAKLGSK